MNVVQRFKALMAFEPVDRLPRVEWAPWWNQTLERWHGEGLPADLSDTVAVQRYFGLDPLRQCRLLPRRWTFPDTGRHGYGPVADARDYEAVRPHLYPSLGEDPRGARLGEWIEDQRRGEQVVWLTVDGFFWFPRTLFGIERHLYAFYDQPDLMHRMNADLAEYIVGVLEEVGRIGAPVFMTLAEDMSYNHGPMISQALFEEFLAPYYRRVVPRARELGTLVVVDSDGDVSAMVPWFAEVGVEAFLPLERQAGVDAGVLRRAHPRLRMIGHFDKMTMACGEGAMRAEFERLLPVMRTGGFLPSVDHQTPPGVSLEAYRTYVGLLAEYTERAAE